MDATTKAKLLQQRRDYKKARAADNNHRACPTLVQEENVNHMPVTHVHPRCVDTNDEVEFDTALFEPTNHDSDDEGWFYKSVHQCSFFLICRHFVACITLISSAYAIDHIRDIEEELVIEDAPKDFETMQFLVGGNFYLNYYL